LPRTLPFPSLRRLLPAALLLALAAPACGAAVAGAPPTAPAPAPPPGKAVATFAMGCFWCAEDAYEGLAGVESVISGYTGGRVQDPTYEQVSGHGTGHWEAIQIVYDPQATSYEALLDVFWRNVDPTDGGGQFCDRGDQYRTGIFVHDEEQRRLAEASKQALEDSGRFEQPILTEIVAAGPFYPAEDYHQDYYEKNPLRYDFYRWNCGRDARLEQLWGEQATH
jgi:peptide-methionine (S)-S-oxide reductase